MLFWKALKQESKVEWYRDGTEIYYYKNWFKREGVAGSEKWYYTLTFTYTFQYDNDHVYFAYSMPYSYSDLWNDLNKLMSNEDVKSFVSRNVLCRTIAGNKWEYLTITSKENNDSEFKTIKKKGVIITARVHPGESVGSWMMKGVIDFLTGDSLEAQALRKLFVFKIIPMLNPDGVINGNYRCSLSGGDLNRRWKTPSRLLHPTVYEAKKLCKDFRKEREVVLFWDFHGHSRNKNIFMYGNNIQSNPTASRIFPYIMSKLWDYFSFNWSRFSITKSKETTARISLYRLLNIPWIYTMEASFYGADIGTQKDTHFTSDQLKFWGIQLLQSLIIYWKIDCHEVVHGYKNLSDQSSKLNFDEILSEFNLNKEELIIQSNEESDNGSDSEPSEDNMSEAEISMLLPIKIRKKTNRLGSQGSFKKRQKDLENKLKEKAAAKREELKRRELKSPVKRVTGYKNFIKDRFNLGRIK